MKNLILSEVVESKIYLIRKQKVMIDRDLAFLYNTETKNLNKAVKRNLNRFPKDFMFQLDKNEFKNLKFQFGTSRWGGTRKLPYVFTEHGIAMLSSVLNSDRAIAVNIQIIRTFIKLRQLLGTHKDLLEKIEKMERGYDRQFRIVFDIIRELNNPIDKKRKQIGFKVK